MADRQIGGIPFEEFAKAVMMVESSGGTNIGPRYESGFERRYGQKWLAQGDTAFRQSMLEQFGPQAIYASYGPFQIMYPVAVEMGFRGTPQELADPEINRQFFEKKIQRDFKSTGGDVRKTLLRYNGGGNPQYPDKVFKFLNQATGQVYGKAQRQIGGGVGMVAQAPKGADQNTIMKNLYIMDKQVFRGMFGTPMTPQEMKAIATNMQNPKPKGQGQPQGPQGMLAQNMMQRPPAPQQPQQMPGMLAQGPQQGMPQGMMMQARSLTQPQVQGIANQVQQTGTFNGTQAPVYNDGDNLLRQTEKIGIDQQRIFQELLRRGINPMTIDDQNPWTNGSQPRYVPAENLAKRPQSMLMRRV